MPPRGCSRRGHGTRRLSPDAIRTPRTAQAGGHQATPGRRLVVALARQDRDTWDLPKPVAKSRPYVVVYRAAGKQRKESCRTMAEARAIKAARETDDLRGAFQARSKIPLRACLAEWIETYQGNGRHGFREGTGVEYRRQLRFGAYAFFGERLKLTDVTPLHLVDFVRWLADPGQQGGRRYSDSSIANRINPLRSALATAKRDGLIRHNPADGLALPSRQRIEEDDENTTEALSRDQLRQLLEIAPDDYKLLIETMASTGLRISGAIALQRRDLRLDDELHPHLRVRRAIVRGRVEPPKSKHGRRKVPLSRPLAAKLRAHIDEVLDRTDTAWVFASQIGTPLDADNLRSRLIKPPHAPDRRPMGGMAHPPPHLRIPTVRPRRQRRPTLPRARPPRRRLHPRHLHSRTRRRGCRCPKPGC